MIECKIYGKNFSQITESHLRKHNTTSREYIEKFPNAHMRSDKFKLSIIHNKERGRKISESHIGKPSGMLGKHHNEESKRKIADAQRGDKNSSKRPDVFEKYIKAIKAKANKGEKALYSILQTILPNEYKINVKADIMTLGGKIPNFVNVNGSKKLIEFNGDYWHTEEEAQQRAEYFKKYGWDTLFIWEHEMKNKNMVINKIYHFHNLPCETLSIQLTLD